MGCAESKTVSGGGLKGIRAGDEGWAETITWTDDSGAKRKAKVSTLPGWRWGMHLAKVPHPKDWTESLWQVLERLIVSNGLIALDDDIVCTPQENEKLNGIDGLVDLDAIAAGDNEGFLDAFHASLARLVAMEARLFEVQGEESPSEGTFSSSVPHGIDRELTITQARMFALSEHEHMVRTCRAAALAVQNLVVEGKAQYAIKRVVSAIVDTGAVNLSFTNLRYHIAKYFGYVLPTEAIIEWMCTKYEGCKRVISVGSGTSFLELALQVRASERFGSEAFQVVCVENNIELLGLGNEEIHADQGLSEQKPRGFRADPTTVRTKLPKFRAGDAVLICWGEIRSDLSPVSSNSLHLFCVCCENEGRSPEAFEQKGNVWTDAEAMAVKTPGVDTCITIGACDWQYFRPDRWAGHVLQAPGMPPFDPVHDVAGQSGLPYGWWWTVTGAVDLPKDKDEASPPATWHGEFGNCMTLYKHVSNNIVCWKRLEEPKHYESSSAVVASVGETPTNSAPPATATATAIEADTPLFVEYPTLGTRCRVMAQSGAGLSLGNIFEILKHNPVLQGALGLALNDETTASSASKTTALPLSRLRLSLTQDGSNVEYLSGSDMGAATEGQLKANMVLYLVPR